jgi:hypothetical protein
VEINAISGSVEAAVVSYTTHRHGLNLYSIRIRFKGSHVVILVESYFKALGAYSGAILMLLFIYLLIINAFIEGGIQCSVLAKILFGGL